MNKKQILLLGGGYTTLWAYHALVRHLRKEIVKGEVIIRVICPEAYHYFHGWTAESLTGIVRNENRMSSLAEAMPLAELINGYAIEIDRKENLVFVNLQTRIQSFPYDHLLIGMGSFDSEQIASVKRYGYQIKSNNDFLRTQRAIRSIVHRAAQLNRLEAEKLLQFTVCGAGYTGVELVTNLAEFIALLKGHYPSLSRVGHTIRLVHGKATILDAIPDHLKRMRSYAARVMNQYGIEILLSKRVTEIAADGAFLDDRSFLPSGMVISTNGQSRVCLKGTEQMERDSLDRLCTNQFLQVSGQANIWGGGDACAVPFRNTRESCIPNALWAMKQGEYAGINIARTIRGKSLKSFDYGGLGQCASLGIGKGIGELHGMVFTGWIAWIMRWCFFNYFMPSRQVMLREISDWMYLLFTGRRRGLLTVEQRTQFHEKPVRLFDRRGAVVKSKI